MKAKHILFLGAALTAASVSFASEYDDFRGFVSTKSRAEVIAERDAAIASGALSVPEYAYPVIAAVPGAGRSRQEVLAELKQFRAEHPFPTSDLNYPDVFASAPMPGGLAAMGTSTTSR
jgi:hypothetical protein